MGSKSRIAKHIVPILQKYIDENNITCYVEPFVGGANIIDKIKCEYKFGSDVNCYLIALLQHIQQGLPLLETVPKQLYDKVRSAYNNRDTSMYEDWYVGNVGFLASFNGRWFDGGYAKTVYEKTQNGLRERNYYREAKDNLLKQSANLKDIDFAYANYKNLVLPPKEVQCLVYCDPPYNNVKKFANSTHFDYKEFWQWVRDSTKDNNIVIVSELYAPDDFEVIWEQKVLRSIKPNDKRNVTEKLFIYKGD